MTIRAPQASRTGLRRIAAATMTVSPASRTACMAGGMCRCT